MALSYLTPYKGLYLPKANMSTFYAVFVEVADKDH